MSLLTLEKTTMYDSSCKNLLKDKQIQLACVVNNKGRIIAGHLGKFPSGFEDERNFEVFLMEIALEFSMKREFDNKLGFVEYVFSKRKWANVISIPLQDDVLVIITPNNMEPQEIVKKCMPLLETSLINSVI
jgi:hypothetical protein